MIYRINRLPSLIPLGVQGEKNARVIEINVRPWLNEWPDARIEITHQRHGEDAPYIAADTEVEDGILRWKIGLAETAIPGMGEMMVTAISPIDDAIVKTADTNTDILPSLPDAELETPPDAHQGWVDRVLEETADNASQAESAAKRAEEAAERAENGSVDEEKVEQIISDYLEKNPIEGVTPDQVDQVVQNALQEAKESGEFDGEKGDDGGYYAPSVDDSGILTWEASKAGMPAVPAANIKGKDGYTPVKGKDYFDGEPGYTPVKGIDYFDGEPGYTPVKGVDYFDGEPGKTPVKGTDYFTDADKAEMVNAVIAALPVYGGETA